MALQLFINLHISLPSQSAVLVLRTAAAGLDLIVEADGTEFPQSGKTAFLIDAAFGGLVHLVVNVTHLGDSVALAIPCSRSTMRDRVQQSISKGLSFVHNIVPTFAVVLVAEAMPSDGTAEFLDRNGCDEGWLAGRRCPLGVFNGNTAPLVGRGTHR